MNDETALSALLPTAKVITAMALTRDVSTEPHEEKRG
jgi:hypothetical protein